VKERDTERYMQGLFWCSKNTRTGLVKAYRFRQTAAALTDSTVAARRRQ
jgi:hypothetical protein